MSIHEFLKYKYACQAAREWADGKSLQEIWETCPKTGWLIWLLKKLGFETRNFQELAISSAEGVTHLMLSERSRQTVKELRRWLNGEQVDLVKLMHFTINSTYTKNGSNADMCAITALNAALAETAHHAFLLSCVGFIYAAGHPDIIRNHIPFIQFAEMATKIGIEI